MPITSHVPSSNQVQDATKKRSGHLIEYQVPMKKKLEAPCAIVFFQHGSLRLKNSYVKGAPKVRDRHCP
jgi:hypothetical protein